MQNFINFFGTGVRYWLCRIPDSEMNIFKAFKEDNDLDWEDLFFDLHILKDLGYTSFEDFELIDNGAGWLNQERNWIEVKRGRRKKKISSQEFTGENLIFDLYQKQSKPGTYEKKTGFQDLLILQYEKGLIAKYQLDVEHCDLDRFEFIITPGWMNELLKMQWVESLLYEKVELRMINEDTIVVDNRVSFL